MRNMGLLLVASLKFHFVQLVINLNECMVERLPSFMNVFAYMEPTLCIPYRHASSFLFHPHLKT